MSEAAPMMRVMIVEDEALVSEFISWILEDTPHQLVGIAETGADALRLAEQEKPDLALVDITLRGAMNGLEVLAHLRETAPGMRVILASGSHDPLTRAQADALAPDGILKKPFLSAHLLDVLGRVARGNGGAR